MKGFRNYDKQELFNYIDRLSIEKENGQVITKYGRRVIKVANVSNRYEIFDMKLLTGSTEEKRPISS